MKLILASSSPQRTKLLEQLGLKFQIQIPDVDESILPNETAPALVQRLAQAKAQAVRERLKEPNDYLILGSDQVASVDGAILGKPDSPQQAKEQLRRQSNETVEFFTAVYLSAPTEQLSGGETVVTRVRFRCLSDAEIWAYLEQESVLGAAGSFKSEGLGIGLCEAIESDDPTALIGLPLIATRRLLAQTGFKL